jgi:peptidyl-prolyl cis-trans isomerase C
MKWSAVMPRKVQGVVWVGSWILNIFIAFTVLAQETLVAPKEKAGSDKVEAAVAVVEGAKIYDRDLQMTIREMHRQFGDKESAKESPEALRRKALEQFVAVELLCQEGKALNLPEVDKQVEAMWTAAEKQAGSKEKFEEQLTKEGLMMDQARENIKKNIYVRAVISQKIQPLVKVSDAELEAAYQANLERYRHGEMIGARHILIQAPQEATEEQKKQAKEKIESVLKEAQTGKDFSELAKTHSDCPSKTRGGDLGYFGKGRMAAAFETAAFALKEGEVSTVVETQFGFHLIQVYGKKPPGITPLPEVRQQVEAQVKSEKFQKTVNEYVFNLRQKAKIEILDPTLKEK